MPDTITFGVTDLSGEQSTNPTALDFSETGNPVLFVAQQNGTIYRYEIERQPDGADADTSPDFVVTSSTAIDVVPAETQNFNDDGTLNSKTFRQMTGLVATTDAEGNDVLYVTSSDWRISVGEDSGLDTNSSQIHRLVLDPDTGAVLSNIAIVRGLPRSEENHSINGLDLSVDPDTGDTYLWVAIGGNTNKGAPGNNFAGTVDFAYSASVIKINLTDLESYDIRTDASGNLFILDMPQNVILRKDAGVDSLEGLSGVRFNPGIKGSSTESTTEAVFTALGLEADYVRGSTTDIVGAIKDNRVAGYVKSGSGMKLDGSTMDIATSTDITVVGLSDAEADTLREKMPDISVIDIPEGAADGIPAYTTWSFGVGVAAPASMDDETAYKIVSAIMADDSAQANAMASLKGADLAQMTLDYGTVPLHPGAARWFEEQGLEIPVKLQPGS